LDSFPAPQRPDFVTPNPAPPARDTEPAPHPDSQLSPGGLSKGERAMDPDASPPDDAQLSPGAWLTRNGPYLVIGAALVAFLYYKFGLVGLWSILLVLLGLGLVIFVHELGHFAVAKWCDVYVQTFSIGFGPALPGCRLKWGETVYKISLLPLGGYVQMLGEGTDSEEDEDNPRSYKNKPVGQRMMIISAGVVMNVILACICFIVVFMGPGKERPAGEIGSTEPGNQAWKKGIPSGAVLTRIGNRVAAPDRPLYFTDLLAVVLSSTEGEKIPLEYDVYTPVGDPQARPQHFSTEIEPRKSGKADRPMIGVSPPDSVELFPALGSKERPFAYQANSAAAAARQAFPWHPEDVVLATTDPDSENSGALKDLPPADPDREGYTRALAQRWYALAGKPMTLKVRRHGAEKPEEVVTQSASLDFGDTVVGSTDPEHPDQVTTLPEDPRHPGSKRGDFFAFNKRLRLLKGRFMVIRVRHDASRHHDKPEEDLLLPPAYHTTLGVRMRMGQVAGIREGSAADTAGVKDGDILEEVLLKADDAREPRRFVVSGAAPAKLVDPVRLPSELRRWADQHHGVRAVLTVVHTNAKAERERVTETLAPEVPWDTSWRFDIEQAGSASAPLAIPELGLAYRIDTFVEDVAADGPAAGVLQKNDIIKEIRYQKLGAKADQWSDTDWDKLESEQWVWRFETLQRVEGRKIGLKVTRGGKEEEVSLTLRPDYAWPMAQRGLELMPDFRLQKASNPAQALVMGVDETLTTILDVYRQLRGFLTGRIGHQNAGGPLKIAVIAYSAASMGIWELLFFMGVISINLAVINFLPIPFLDGGHMVFLIYEKIRGRPARESVMAFATYTGLLFLLLLMVAVFYLDISSMWRDLVRLFKG
jgi:regulator of sigma E protease